MQFRFKYLFLFLIIIHISCTITSIYYYTKKNKTQEDNNISSLTRKVPIYLSIVLVIIVAIRIFIVAMPPPFSKTFILLLITYAFFFLYAIADLIFFIKKDYDYNKMFGPDIGMNVVFIILYIILLLMNENIFRGDIGVSLIPPPPPPPPAPRYPRAAIARIISENSNLIDVRNKGNAFPRGVPEIIGDYAEEW